METKQAQAEEAATKAKAATLSSKAPVIEMSGTHYLGFVNSDKTTGAGVKTTDNQFETRRNYFQVKGFFAENPKDYVRLTLDATYSGKVTEQIGNPGSTLKDEGYSDVIVKYAYLYLDNILPYTGVEIGQAHRPWIDYEEHHGWWYRSISKVLVEDDNAAHFTNSADLGLDFKTKTENFSSELGIFNGEGYHGTLPTENKLSFEYRLTAHLLGTGMNKEKADETYANVSFFGQNNKDYKGAGEDFNWYGVHGVYNNEDFLLAAQYVKASKGGSSYEGKGWSINGEYRFMKDWNSIARYDNFKLDSGIEKKRTIAGIAYEYNSNVELIANLQKTDVSGSSTVSSNFKDNALMLTACIEW
jgi:hypothetical protein